MRTTAPKSKDGIALVVVMIAITVLSVLAAAFAFSMKVETRLKQTANAETELIWLGRSGVEFARWFKVQEWILGNVPYDALNQKWNFGPGTPGISNSFLADFNLKGPHQAGQGEFEIIGMVDLDRRYNINMADQAALEQAMRLVGVDAGDATAAVSSILDWIDADDNTHVSGTESDYYQSQDPPYFAKNQPIDDLSELWMIRGLPEIMIGTGMAEATGPFADRLGRFSTGGERISAGIHFTNLFTAVSGGLININTADRTSLQMIPYVDEVIADQIITLRNGPDGAEATEDDMPAGSPGAGGDVRSLLLSAGMNPQAVPFAAQKCSISSLVWEVQVRAKIGGAEGTFIGTLARDRANPRNFQVVSFRRIDEQGKSSGTESGASEVAPN